MDKEVQHGWALPLTIDPTYYIKDTGILPLGVAGKLSINEKDGRYAKRRVNHECYLPVPPVIYLNNRLMRNTRQPLFCVF